MKLFKQYRPTEPVPGGKHEKEEIKFREQKTFCVFCDNIYMYMCDGYGFYRFFSVQGVYKKL